MLFKLKKPRNLIKFLLQLTGHKQGIDQFINLNTATLDYQNVDGCILIFSMISIYHPLYENILCLYVLENNFAILGVICSISFPFPDDFANVHENNLG